MRILFVLPFLPYPPYNGGRTRILSLVSALSHSHDLTLACLRKTDDQLDLTWYQQHGINILAHPRSAPFSLISIWRGLRLGSFYAGVYYSPKLRKTVRDLLCTQQFDLIHLVCSYALPNLPAGIKIPLIIEDPNLESIVVRQRANLTRNGCLKLLFMREACRLQRMESYGAAIATRYVVTSPTDRNAVESWNDRSSVRLVPNGVDTDRYGFQRCSETTAPTLVFLGNFSYFPNVDSVEVFVRDIFPAVRARFPNVKLKIVGYRAETKIAPHIANNSSIEVLAYRADTRADLAQAWISVCPLRMGSGSRLKILESMAVGTPVVSTPLGCSGLPVEDGKNIRIATTSTMANAIIELLQDHSLRNRLAVAARSLVETQMTWRQSVSILNGIYSEICPRPT